MIIKELVKNNRLLFNLYKVLSRGYFSLLTQISPELNTKARYKQAFKKKLNLNNPESLNEKILWLKLNRYMKDPLVIQCADKYRVRDYVKQCGCGSILNELIGVYDSPKEIPWEELPNQFALKWNFGAGMNIICTDKSKMKKDDVIQQLEKWSKCKCWLSHSEMQYKYIPKKIIIEKYLEEDSRKTISDYKVYCFHSKPIAIMVMHDRENNLTAEFFDKNWNKLSISKYKEPTTRTEIPNCLKEMLDASRELSRPFPFVRIDYYVIKNRLVFGELTFTPAGGLYLSQTDVAGRNMSDFLSIM